MLLISRGQNSVYQYFTFKGKNARMLVERIGVNNTCQQLQYRFEIPSGGFAEAPLQLSKTGDANFYCDNVPTLFPATRKVPLYSFAVTAESPALKEGAKAPYPLVAWAGNGIANYEDKGVDPGLVAELAECPYAAKRGNTLLYTVSEDGSRKTGVAAQLYPPPGLMLFVR